MIQFLVTAHENTKVVGGRDLAVDSKKNVSQNQRWKYETNHCQRQFCCPDQTISLESCMVCPDGSGTKTKSYKSVSQIACVSVSIFFGTKHTHSCIPGLKGEALFSKLCFFAVSADRRLVRIRILLCIMEFSSSFGDSNCPQVHVCIPTYVGCVSWSHT